VLLKNDAKTMPFAAGTTFSFFGESSRSLTGQTTASSYLGGSGSYDGLNAAFAAEGMNVNLAVRP